MAQLLCNRAYSPKDMPKDPYELIDEAVKSDKMQSFVLVVPTGRLVRHFRMKIIRDYYNYHQKPVSNINIFKLDTFVRYCFEKIAGKHSYRIISDAYRLALFEEAAENTQFGFFARNDRPLTHSVLQRLASIIIGIKEDGISVADLKEELAFASDNLMHDIDIPRLSDITALYSKYQELLNGKYLDYPDLINTLVSKLESIDNKTAYDELFPSEETIRQMKFINTIFPDGTKVFFYGFSEFKIPEQKLVTIFSKSKLPYAIHIDYSTDNGPLFGNLEDSLMKLSDEGFRLIPIDNTVDTNSDFARKHPEAFPKSLFLRKALFSTDEVRISKGFSGIVKIIAAENRMEEVRCIARLVKQLHFSKNIPLSEICISMRHADIYPDLFREVFSQYKIPVNISDRYHLSKSPVAIGLFSVLDMVIRGYRIEDVHRALKSQYLTFSREMQDGTIVNPDGNNLYDTAVRLRISGGFRRGGAMLWKERLEKAVNSYNLRLKNMKSDSAIDPVEIDSTGKQLQSMQKAYEDFIIINDLLTFENKAYTPSEFIDILKNDIIVKLRIKENIMNFYNEVTTNLHKYTPDERVQMLERVEKDTRAYAALIKLIDEMAYLITDRKPGAKFRLEDYVQKLRTAVSAERYSTREKQNYGVTVTSVEQTRGIPYRVMVLCGALDGEFPLMYRPESFLGKDLPDTEERFIRSERMLFYQFMSNAPEYLDNNNKEIYITYPKTDGTEELVRSPFVDALLKITDLSEQGCIYDVNELKSSQNQSADSISDQNFPEWISALACESDILRIIGEHEYKSSYFGIQLPLDERVEAVTSKNGFGSLCLYVRNSLKNKLSGYEPGLLELKSNDEAIANISALKKKAFSITELETYVGCPFKYYSKNIIELEEEKEFDLSLTPMEQGNLFHLILYRFYSILQAEQKKDGTAKVIKPSKNSSLPDIAPVRLDPARKAAYKKLLLKLAKEEIDRIRFEHPFFEVEEADFFGSRKKPGYLETWLVTELERMEKEWDYSPSLFEFNFGMKSRGSKKDLLPVDLDGGVKIMGKIDRIEFRESEDGLEFIIADYKSSLSSLPGNKEIGEGNAFQVSLYLLAAEKIFREYYGIEAVPNGGVYYSLKPKYDQKKKQFNANQFILLPRDNVLYPKSGSKRATKGFVEDKTELRDLLSKSVDHARQKIDEISSGIFPIQPAAPKKCKDCSYIKVCRIRERAGADITAQSAVEEE